MVSDQEGGTKFAINPLKSNWKWRWFRHHLCQEQPAFSSWELKPPLNTEGPEHNVRNLTLINSRSPTELAASKSCNAGCNAGHQDLDVQPRSSYLPEDKRSCCIHTLKLWISTLTHKCHIPTFTVAKADRQNQGSGTTAHSLRAVSSCSLTCITNTLNNIWRT